MNKFKYVCAEDGANMSHNRNKELQSFENDDKKVILTKSLGTWTCPKCGGKKVKRVKVN